MSKTSPFGRLELLELPARQDTSAVVQNGAVQLSNNHNLALRNLFLGRRLSGRLGRRGRGRRLGNCWSGLWRHDCRRRSGHWRVLFGKLGCAVFFVIAEGKEDCYRKRYGYYNSFFHVSIRKVTGLDRSRRHKKGGISASV